MLLDDDGYLGKTSGLPHFETFETVDDFEEFPGGDDAQRHGAEFFSFHFLRAAIDRIRIFQLFNGKKTETTSTGLGSRRGGFRRVILKHGITPDPPPMAAAMVLEDTKKGFLSSPSLRGTSLG